jgi:hypothetical protein
MYILNLQDMLVYANNKVQTSEGVIADLKSRLAKKTEELARTTEEYDEARVKWDGQKADTEVRNVSCRLSAGDI